MKPFWSQSPGKRCFAADTKVPNKIRKFANGFFVCSRYSKSYLLSIFPSIFLFQNPANESTTLPTLASKKRFLRKIYIGHQCGIEMVVANLAPVRVMDVFPPFATGENRTLRRTDRRRQFSIQRCLDGREKLVAERIPGKNAFSPLPLSAMACHFYFH